ncbi:DUF2975 domain-containing protein [Maribellus sediminis]|uniref:DUF2975 domain-containing protein n=1 Tax=Maribellus sediminis TaxID=2696285 RepID=UPI00142FBE49|nr:DUF2975 domain-containing protein [Maribellus sediminis]
MEIKITTKQILKVLQILSWIIFIGLCIEAGGIVVNTVIIFFRKPSVAFNFWDETAYLTDLYQFDHGHFFAIALIMIIVSVLKAILFYLIVKLFTDKQLNITRPFNIELKNFIINLSSLSFGIGLFSYFGMKYSVWLTTQGAQKADLKALHLSGADVWIFMAIILFVIGQVMKSGIEMQNENELTI